MKLTARSVGWDPGCRTDWNTGADAGAYIVDLLALAGIRPEPCNAEFAVA
jgi:hypothetical protein